MRKATKTIKPLKGASDPRHGTPSGYSYWGCRCGKCRAASTEAARQGRKNAVVKNHGRGGYDLGCRCGECHSGKRKSENERRKLIRDWKNERPYERVDKVNLFDLA
jgi:hypothetical protein